MSRAARNSRRGVSLANQLADALVIEENGHAAGTDEDGDAVAGDQGVGEVDFEPDAAYQLDRERTERLALPQCLEGVLKIVGRHCRVVSREAQFRENIGQLPA